ncbi:tRNA (adenosine(37)-N6)-threonylcarbamoyltransferase complex transferase subunit TsaD [Malaciobacter mytili]|uniref:tRNA N6-adenosine threonylcarbamoyltransferase n=1 Tax=Malaciobacter mytili LMG 24559 TaxID=1032238 RepID=A0AAX2AEL8_9BACT|nr:tRNA (adenosine(37)-N6)-threonylcarbamoyltransferase complex transferase subunit TsaD [Malaciobacter mytili]AXH13873.1 N6-L-threonylcarbamoyladenine synthase, TsaD subunit [Malaciobacter mytili LMG 24559]RXI37154.1 tRNA (adenosine(37)-N6)-threonylcarbamoyltransferase complex transferase subunit TsaD [Malaciobacter mytili]RXK15474.1 tRNA (adenosine(37)-N6)-threonylcarbamoyltransferase complex transferase subunit TsaD [Malaciobacter mytili LMG 24559]
MILSIESSCDDSSIAVTDIKTKKLIFHKKISQELQHSQYGGVVPELAARLHVEALPKILEETSEYFDKLKAIAVTNSPGLSVTLMEGVTMAKALATSLELPLIAVNHLKGHIYSLFIEEEEIFPITILLVSGGHTQIIEANSYEDMKIVATTIDDSFGESFDKVSKMMNLGYPGGPIVQEYSLKGDENRFDFPIPLRQSPKIEFSYSGLKNAVRLKIEELNELSTQDIADICASFQKTAVAHIMQKLKKLFKQNPPKNFAIVGGASANIYLRKELESLCKKYNTSLYLSQLKYCSDNAAMIGRVALKQYEKQEFTSIENIDIQTRIKAF